MSSLISSVRENAYAAKAKSVDVLDKQIPPSRRQEFIQNVKDWSSENPKLAGFVFVQLVLSGIPILVFGLFATVVLISSLATCLIIGLVLALSFTAFCVGAGLLLLLPIVFVTSIAATFVFIWGLLGYYVTRRLNNAEMPVHSVHEAREKLRDATNDSVARIQSTYKTNVEPMLTTPQKKQSTQPNGVGRNVKNEEAQRDIKLSEEIEVPLKVEKGPTGTIQIAPQQ